MVLRFALDLSSLLVQNDGLLNSTSFNYFHFFILARATVEEERAFLEEIDLIKSVGFHKNIINVIGSSTMMKPLFLVLEYMSHGDLLHYLRKKRTDVSFHWVLKRCLYFQQCINKMFSYYLFLGKHTNFIAKTQMFSLNELTQSSYFLWNS